MAIRNLSVYLNQRLVGNLPMLGGTTFLAFDKSYLEDPNRPILSLSYKNVLNEIEPHTIRPSAGLPPFFWNLLPEGKLLTYLAKRAGVNETQEYKLLAALKEDLPGAIRLETQTDSEPDEEITEHLSSVDGPLRFSLAGIQWKFSGNLQGNRLTIPAVGVGGHWIVKLPSPDYKDLPELEYAMLLLASKMNIVVPEFELISTANIQNLPKDLPEAFEGNGLISKRFDRIDNGGRIHMEDFAQVFNIRDKYDQNYNYQSIANVLWSEIGLEAVLEFVRRLVHMIVTGNGDMHLKNWVLIYPNGRQPRLSPAYDYVSTVVYGAKVDRKLALNIAGTNDFTRINLDTFRKFAAIANLPERPILNTAIEAVDAIKEWWPKIQQDPFMPDSFKSPITEHMKSVPLFYEQVTRISAGMPPPPSQTWPGTYFFYEMKLDDTIPDGKIEYKSQLGKILQADAPRSLSELAIKKQLHQIISEHPEFANQTIRGFIGLSLYDRWRKDNFLRIQYRSVQGRINASHLQKSELQLQVVFPPLDWKTINKHLKAKEQAFTIDFELENGEIWACECMLASIIPVKNSELVGEMANIHIFVRTSEKLYTLPEAERDRYGSTKFSIPASLVENKSHSQTKKDSDTFSGYIFPIHTNNELSITMKEANEGFDEYRYLPKHFNDPKTFLQCLQDIGVPEEDLPKMKPDGFNRMVRLSNVPRNKLEKWGLLQKL